MTNSEQDNATFLENYLRRSTTGTVLLQQEHLECHIEVTLEQLLQRLGLSPKARVSVTPESVDWAAVGRAGFLELGLTDTITVAWDEHREVAR